MLPDALCAAAAAACAGAAATGLLAAAGFAVVLLVWCFAAALPLQAFRLHHPSPRQAPRMALVQLLRRGQHVLLPLLLLAFPARALPAHSAAAQSVASLLLQLPLLHLVLGVAGQEQQCCCMCPSLLQHTNSPAMQV